MLNTNFSNTQPKAKELLLERRHSICLEVSKKRRQSVASSIFIPKDHHHQTEPRVNEKVNSEKKSISSLRNKKCHALLKNKRRNICRLISKKKLKRVAITSKNKCISKAKTVSTTIKHPESYPIIKQTVSSEKIRFVVESLKDDKITKSVTLSTDDKETETVSDSLIKNTDMERESREVGEDIETKELQVLSNDPILLHRQDNEHNDAKTEQPVSNSNDEKKISEIQHSSINRVDNFVIMVDANAGLVEIKYAGPSSSPNKVEALRNQAEMEVCTSAHDKTQDHINVEYREFSYVKINDSPTNMKVMDVEPLYQSNACCTNTSTKCRNDQIKSTHIGTYDTSRPKIKQSNPEELIDLSLKETTSEMYTAKAVHRRSGAELIYDTNQGLLNTQQVAYGPQTHSLLGQQTRLACHQQFLDQSCIFNKNSASQPTSHNHNSEETTKKNSDSARTAVNTFQPESYHHHSFGRPKAHLETPPISPIDCQWTAPPSKYGFPFHDQQQGFRKSGISKVNELSSDSTRNIMSSELAYGPCKNTNYPSAYIFHEQLPRNLRGTRHTKPFDKYITFHHQIDHIQPTHQSAQQHQVCYARQQYPQQHLQQMSFPSQMYSQLDLPRQFYNPLHQSFLSNPYHDRSSFNTSPSNGVCEPKEITRFNCRNNIFPNVRFKPLQTYLPSTPPITDRCFSPAQSTPTSLPFPSPNWTNTLYNNSSLPLKTQPCWNILPHLYSVQSILPSETDVVSRLHAPASSEIPVNASKDRTHNNICFPTPIRTQPQHQLPLNYL